MEIHSQTGAQQTPLAELDRSLSAKHKPKRHKLKRILFASVLGVLLLAAAGFAVKVIFFRPTADVNPFTPSIMASMQFPLYYPTKLPSGFRIDTHSVTVPQAGVVVFNLLGPNKQKLYFSEEARPTNFGVGKFYANLHNLKEIVVGDSTIAVGQLGNGPTRVVSRANNKTWLVADTNAAVSYTQLIAMMRSLTVSY